MYGCDNYNSIYSMYANGTAEAPFREITTGSGAGRAGRVWVWVRVVGHAPSSKGRVGDVVC